MGEVGKGREGEKGESRGRRGREEDKRYVRIHEKSEVKVEQVKSERRTRMQQPLPLTEH